MWKGDAQAAVLPRMHGFALLRVGRCGWLGCADGFGYEERAGLDCAMTDEHREGAGSYWLSLSRGCAARGKAAQRCQLTV